MEAKAVIDQGAAVTHLARTQGHAVIFVVQTMLVFFSAFRLDRRVVLFSVLLRPGAEWACLRLVICKIAYA